MSYEKNMVEKMPNGALDDEVVSFSLELANKVFDNITFEHYEYYLMWCVKKNNSRWSPFHFVKMLGNLSDEEVHKRLFARHYEKGTRVEDHYEKLPAPVLENK